jgi:hypothetical protein
MATQGWSGFQYSNVLVYTPILYKLARRKLSVTRPFKGQNPKTTTRMSENDQPTAKKTLGLTGLTVNAMALIAAGAFLWLTFAQQSLYGQPMAGIAMWFGILVALLLCLATPSLMPNSQNSIQVPVRRTSSPNRPSYRPGRRSGFKGDRYANHRRNLFYCA